MKRALLILVVILAAAVILLAVVPPLVPLASLQLKVEGRLQDFLGQPVSIGALRFQVLPLPAFTVEKLVVGNEAAGGPLLVSDSVEAGLDLLALGRGRMVVDALAFKKPRLAGKMGDGPFLSAGLLSLVPGLGGNAAEKNELVNIPGSIMDHAGAQFPFVRQDSRFTVRVVDGDFRLMGVPGLADGLQLQNVAGRYTCDPSHSGSMLHGEGACLGGRFGADFYWHLPRDGAEAVPGALQVDGKLKLVGLLLKNLGLQLGPSVNSLDILYGSGNLELEINGQPDKGVAFGCQVSLNDLMVERSVETSAIKQRLVQNLSIDLVGSGYLAIKNNYINLKNVRLKLPGDATIFSKGLVKYGDRLVLDVLNDVKVPKLEALTARLPALPGALAFLAGDCSGNVNIIGNLAANPVLRLNLSSKHLSLLKPGTGEKGVTAATGNRSVGGRKNRCAPLEVLKHLLAWSTDSDWLAEVHCRVEKLDLCPASFSGVELVGKKLINQLEVEKLAAKSADGELRLSLVVDDLLHDPLWNTSLVVKKVRLEKILPAGPLRGEMDGSLVLGGEAPAAGRPSSSWVNSIRGRGMVTVAKGEFKPHRFTRSLFGFSRLVGLQPGDFLVPFNRLRLPLKIAAGTCRLQTIRLESPWYSFQGAGRLGLDGSSLILRGVLSYGRPGNTFSPGHPFPHRRELSARGKLEALVWH